MRSPAEKRGGCLVVAVLWAVYICVVGAYDIYGIAKIAAHNVCTPPEQGTEPVKL